MSLQKPENVRTSILKFCLNQLYEVIIFLFFPDFDNLFSFTIAKFPTCQLLKKNCTLTPTPTGGVNMLCLSDEQKNLTRPPPTHLYLNLKYLWNVFQLYGSCMGRCGSLDPLDKGVSFPILTQQGTLKPWLSYSNRTSNHSFAHQHSSDWRVCSQPWWVFLDLHTHSALGQRYLPDLLYVCE